MTDQVIDIVPVADAAEPPKRKWGGKQVGAGQKGKFTEEIKKAICDHLRLGLYIEQAAILAGIQYRTLAYWMQRAQNGERKYVEFAEQLQRASAEAEGHALKIVREGKKSWQANAWFLERRFRRRYARPWDGDAVQAEVTDIQVAPGPQQQPKRLIVRFVKEKTNG